MTTAEEIPIMIARESSIAPGYHHDHDDNDHDENDHDDDNNDYHDNHDLYFCLYLYSMIWSWNKCLLNAQCLGYSSPEAQSQS